jgi:pilus assembly protein HofN
MTWQQDTLELTGNTLNFAALKALEAQLRQLPLFMLNSPEKRSRMRRDAGNSTID